MGLRGQYWVRNSAVWSEVSPLGCLGGWSFVHARSVFRATGRPSSCAFEGRYAPRSPDPRTNDESPFQQQRPDAVRGPKQRGEHQPSKPLGWREKLSRPRSQRVNTEIRRPTRAAELEPKHVLVAIQCRHVPRNMPLVAIQCRTIRQWGSTRLLR